ncbi:hypothetical protein BS47DRAFT_308316 [Hydnum rufescens UP504]|uniref:Uncharacterized protein n=1 Tax=Hydnum rufescens UP504 TaxID=1448309 RepID=A0A9P6AKE6_9AGAM|nr:hypothetical protein BS47DRAFT_308316 [Hydnum rufescens UP504]
MQYFSFRRSSSHFYVRASTSSTVYTYSQLPLAHVGHMSLIMEPNINEFEAFPLSESVPTPLLPLHILNRSGGILPRSRILPSNEASDNGAESSTSLPLSVNPSTTARLVRISSTSANPVFPSSGSLTHSISSYNSKSISTPLVAQSPETSNGSMTPPTTVPLIVIAPASPPPVPLPSGSASHSTSSGSNDLAPFFTALSTSSTEAPETTTTPATAVVRPISPSSIDIISPATTPSASSLPTSGNTSRTVGVVVGSIFGALLGLILILILSLFFLKMRHTRKLQNDNIHRDIEDRWPPYRANTQRTYGMGRISNEGLGVGSLLSQSIDLDPIPISHPLHVANHASNSFGPDETSPYPLEIYGTPRLSRAPFFVITDNGLSYEEPSTIHLPLPGSEGIVYDPYRFRAAPVVPQHPSTLSADGWRADVLRNKLFTNVLLRKAHLSGPESMESTPRECSQDAAGDHFTRAPTRSSMGSAGRKRHPSTSTGQGLSRLSSAASKYSQTSTDVPGSDSLGHAAAAL